MANRYWVGGAGTWNTTSTTNWSASSGGASGASVPTAADSVFFDQAGTYSVTMTGALLCLDITVSAGVVTFATGTSPTLAISGSMSVLGSTAWNSTGAITFNATTTGKTIATGGALFQANNITFAGSGGGWTLNSTFVQGAATQLTLTTGTLDLNGNQWQAGIFSSTGTGVRSLAFTTGGTINLGFSTAATVLDMAIVTNFTVSGTGGFTATMSVTRTFTFGTTGGSSTNAPNLSLTSGASAPSFTSGSWFNTLNLTGTSGAPTTGTVNVNSITIPATVNPNALSVNLVGTGTITGSTVTTPFAALTVNHSGTTTFGSNAWCTTLTQTSGTVNFATFNLTCSGAVTFTAGTHTNTGTITCTTWTVQGTFTMTTGTITPSTSFVITSGAFNYNGGTLSAVATFTQTAGNVTLGKAYSLTATGTYTLTAGTLDLGGFNLTTGIFASSGTGTRAISFGTGNIVLSHTTALTTVLSMATATGFTWTGTGGFTTNASITRTVVFGTTGGTAANAPNLTLTGSGTAIITFTTGSYFNTLSFGTTAFNPGTTALNLNGLTLSSGGTFSTLTPTFVGTGTITSNGNATLAAMTINSTTGTTTLAAALTLTATSTVTLTSGTLDLGGFNLTTGIFSSTGAVTRAISFGSGTIALAHTTALTTVLSMATATGFTWSGTGGFTTTAAITRTVTFGTTGGTTTNAPNLTLTASGTSVITFASGSWFNALDFGTTAFNPGTTNLNLNSLLLSSGGTFTGLTATMVGTGSINSRTNTTLGVLSISTTSGITTLGAALTLNTNATTTLNSGTLNLGGFNLTTGIFSSNNATTRAISFGSNNIVLAHTTAATTVLAMPIVTGFTNTGTGGFTADASITRTFTFGTTGGSATNAPNLSLTGSGTAIPTITTGSWLNTLNFGSTAFTIAATNLNLNSLSLSTGGTFTSLTATMRGTGTINSNGNTTLGPLVINNSGNTTTLAAALTCTTYTQTAGTIDFANFNLTCSSTASYTAGTLSNIGTISCTTWTIAASSTFTLSQGTITPSTSFVVSASSSVFNYNGGTLTTPAFTQTNGTVTLGAGLNIGSSGTYTLTSGTLNLNGFDLTVGAFSSSNTNTRSIALGSNNIILNHVTAGTTVLSMATVTGFSATGTGGFVTDASTTRTVTFGTTGGSATNSLPLSLTGSGTSVITFTTASWFDKLDFGTTAFTVATTTLNLNSLTLSNGGNFNALTASMRATGVVEGSGNTTLGALTINHTGTTTFSSTLTLLATGTVTLTSGTLDLSGFDLTTGIFSSSGSTARTVTFGSNNIVLAHTTAATTVLSMATVTAFTWTGTGGFASGMSVTRTFTFGTTGGSTTTAPNLFINSGASVPTFTDGSWFEILDFTGSSCAPAMSASVLGIYVDTLTLATGGTFTGLIPVFTRTQTWTAQFSKQLGGIGVNNPGGTLTLDSTQTYTATSSTILTAGTLDLGGADLTTGLLSSSNTNTRAIAFGANKIVLAHTTAATTVLAMANATGFTYTGSGLFNTDASVTRTLTFGTTAGSTTNAPNLTLTGSGTSVITLTTASWYNNLDFGTTAFTIGTTTLNLNGDLTLSSGGTFTGLSPTMVGTGNINNNGKAIAGLVVNNGAGTTSLTAALSCTTFTMTAGTIDFNFFNLTCSGAVTYTSGSMLNFSTVTCTTWTVAGTFTMTSGTITPSVSFVVSSGAFNYNGGTLSPVPTFTHTAGTVTLGQTYALTATGTYTLTAGTLNLNGFNLTTGAFASSGTSTRSIAFGANNIILAHTTVATTVLSMATATGFTNTGTGGFVTDASITRTVTFGTTGGSSTISPNLTLTGSGTAVITFTTASWFNKLDFGTTGFTIGTTTLNLNSFTLSSTGTFTTLTANMVDDGTIINNGNNTLGALTINSTTGTTTLGDAFTISATGATTLTSGTLNLNGFDLTTGSFSSTNSNTRAITFGSNNIVLAHALAGTTVLSMATATGFTWTGTGSFTTDASVTRTYTFGTTGGSATNAPNLLITSGASVPTFTDGSWFNNLNFTGTTCTPAVTASAIGLYVSTLTLATGGTYTSLIPVFTRTQTWTAQFSKQLGGIGVNGTGVTLTLDNTQTYTATSAVFLVAGTIDLGGADLTVGVFNSNNTNTRSVSFGTNNIIIATTTAGQTVLNIPTAAGFSYTGTGGFISDASVTRTFNWGATSGGSSATAPNLSFTGSGTAIQTFQSGGKFGNLNFGTTAFNPGTTALSLNGLTLSSGGTFSTLTATMFGAGTITSNGNTTLTALNINGIGITSTLGDAFTMAATGTVTITNGTLDLNGHDLTTGIFASSGTGTRSISFGSNNIILAHTTAATTVLSFATATGFTWTGTGGFTTDASITRTLTFGTTGGSTTNAPNLTLTGSGTSVITLTTASWFNKLDFGTTTFNPGTTALSLNGLTLSSGGTFTTLTATMVGTGTITSNGNTTLGVLTINSTTGTTTLGAALTLNTNATTTLTSGTLALAGFTLTTGIFSSSVIGTARSISFGSGNIVLAHTTAATTVLAMATVSGFTWTGTGGFTTDASITRTLVFGTTSGSATISPNLTLTGSGTSVVTLTTGSWFNTLDFGTTAFTIASTTLNLNNLNLSSGGTFSSLTATMVGTGAINANGNTTLGTLTINTGSGSTSLNSTLTIAATGTTTLTSGTLTLNGFDLTTGIFSSNNATARAVSFGSNNIVLAHTTLATTVLAMPVATNFSWTGTGGFTTDASITRTLTFGTTGGSTTNSPNLTLTGSGTSVITLTTNSWYNKLDFGTTAFTIGTTTLNLNSLSLSSGGTFTTLTASMRGGGTVISNANATLGNLTINNTGTTTLSSALSLTATGTTTLTAGTLDLNGFNLTTGIFSSTGAVTRSVSFGSNNIILAHTSLATVVLSMANATAFSWTGTGGFTADASITRTYTFGTTGGSTTNSPNLSLTGSGTAIATFTTASWFNTLNFGSTAFAIAATNLNLNNVSLSSGGTFTNLTATMVGTGNITPNGNTTLGPVVINNGSGTTTLPAALSCTTFSMTAGTMDFAFFNLTCSSTFTYVSGTMLNMPTITCTTFTVNGTYTMTAGTINPSVSFVLQSGAFNYNGGTLGAVPTFTHTAGTLTLGQNYALTTTGTYTLTAGTINLNGFYLYTGIFSSSNTNTRSIAFGGTNIYLTHTTAATTVLSMATATGFTNTSNDDFSGFSTDASVTRTVTFGTTGGSATNAPNLTLTGTGTSIITFTTGSFFGALSFGSTAFTIAATTLNLNTLYLSSGGTFTNLTAAMVGTGSITTGGKQIAALTINNVSGTTTLADALSTVVTGTTTLTSGTLDLNGFLLSTGIFSSSNANSRTIVFGASNIALVHTTAATTVLAMANATSFTWSGTGGFTTAMSATRTFTFGTTGGSSTNAPNLYLTSGASTATFTDGSWFDTLDFTGSTSTSAMSASVLGINIDTLTLATGGTYTGFIPVFTRTQTWSMQFSKQLGGIGVNNPGGTLTLSGTQTYTATSSVIVTAGTLDLGGYDITVGLFSSSNSNTRAVTFGSNKIILAHTTAATNVLNIATMTGFTCSGSGGFSTQMSVTRTFTVGTTAGGNSAGAPSLFLTGSGTSLPTLTTSWFNLFDISGLTSFAAFQFINGTSLNINSYVSNSSALLTSQYLNLTFVGTGYISGTSTGAGSMPSITINHNGTTTLNSNLYLDYPGTSQNGGQTPGTFTLTSGTLDLTSYSVLNIASFTSSNSNTRAITGTGGIFLNAASTVGSTILNMANATNFSTSGSWYFSNPGGKTLTFGTTGGSSSNAPNLKITSTLTSTTLTTGGWFNSLDFTGITTGTLATTNLNLNALTLPSGGSAVFTGLSTNMVGTGTITPNGKSIAAMVINNGSGTTTLAGALTTNTSTTLTAGNLALAGYTLTATQFISDGAATRSISGDGTGIISVANDWTVSNGTGFTGNDYTINMTKSTAKTFAGAGGSYGTLVQAGAGDLTISGSNNLYDLKATTTPSTIIFTAGTTQYFTFFSLVGTAGNLVSINSTVAGTQYYLSKSGVRVDVSYLSIQDSNVIGGAAWYNNNGSNTVLSNNTGWNPTGAGGFMAFF